MKKVSNYKGRTQIFYAMLELLSDNQNHNAFEIADKLEIGVRSVSRYVEALEQCGYQIDHIFGRGGGVKLTKNGVTNFVVLTCGQKRKLVELLKNDSSEESKQIITILKLA